MILVKNFETNKLSRIHIDDFGSTIVPYRSLKHPWYKKCLKILAESVDPELLILCPIYTFNEQKDFQIGVTGTKDKKDRNLLETLQRECREELGLDFNIRRGKAKLVDFDMGRQQFLLCIAPMNSFSILTDEEEDFEPKEIPQYNKKIVCFIADTQKNMQNYLSRRVARDPNLSEHSYLKEVAAIPIWYLIDRGII